MPAVGQEKSGQNGLSLQVDYLTLSETVLDPSQLEQGTDFVMKVTVKNTGTVGKYEEVALTSIFPSGWEIRNTRLDPTQHLSNIVFDYMDIRDDRIMTYFDLGPNEQKLFRFMLHASYLGRFYLPMINVEPMYDATIYARKAGQWIEVMEPGK
jgi:uncharacterized protein YfaS (alpha-2-macroglobulin family)